MLSLSDHVSSYWTILSFRQRCMLIIMRIKTAHLWACRTAPSFASCPESPDRNGELADTSAPHGPGRRPTRAPTAAAACAARRPTRRPPALSTGCGQPFHCGLLCCCSTLIRWSVVQSTHLTLHTHRSLCVCVCNVFCARCQNTVRLYLSLTHVASDTRELCVPPALRQLNYTLHRLQGGEGEVGKIVLHVLGCASHCARIMCTESHAHKLTNSLTCIHMHSFRHIRSRNGFGVCLCIDRLRVVIVHVRMCS